MVSHHSSFTEILANWRQVIEARIETTSESLEQLKQQASEHSLSELSPELEVDPYLAQIGRKFKDKRKYLIELRSDKAASERKIASCLAQADQLQEELEEIVARLENELATSRLRLSHYPHECADLVPFIKARSLQYRQLEMVLEQLRGCMWLSLEHSLSALVRDDSLYALEDTTRSDLALLSSPALNLGMLARELHDRSMQISGQAASAVRVNSLAPSARPSGWQRGGF